MELANSMDNVLLLKKSLHAIKSLQSKLNEMEREAADPIAVIGTACRFPGGSSNPERFWEFLKNGGDGVIKVPSSRWNIDDFYDPDPESPGGIYVKEAGFLQENIAEFDAEFFGISPREAVEMDPQQRILLEVSWEALERAGLAPNGLKGSKTGVFIGIIGSEYGSLVRNPASISPYTALGNITNIASGRISYVFGFQGPALSIDTACSSSLVAIHLACESIKRGECEMALAGGVSLMISPVVFQSLCKLRALAVDGRCKSFDAAGDGYGRGEGCGIVVLKRLSAAQKDGDPVLAVIRGSSVNQDGTGSGLTVPNGHAQKELIVATMAKAKITPEAIQYFEAHGTGTALGDPIEIQALTEVFQNGNKRKEPLQIGTVKGNIGHLEAAAGVAGLIKVILSLQNKLIPPNPYPQKINPRLDFSKIPAVIPQELKEWKVRDQIRTAGISSFGFSGTNAHLIVSESVTDCNAPAQEISVGERPVHALAISAKNNEALESLIHRYQEFLEAHPDADLADLCYTANTGRVHFPKRVIFWGGSCANILSQLRQYLQNKPDDSAAEKETRVNASLENNRPKIAFYFGDQADEVSGIARHLYAANLVFKNNLDYCAALFTKNYQIAVKEFLTEDGVDGADGQRVPGFKEACVFTMEYCLFQVWDSWGIKPQAVMGIRTGEYAAACAAGIMSPAAVVELLMRGVTGRGTNGVDIELSKPRIRFVSGSDGQINEKRDLRSGSYWEKRMAQPDNVERGLSDLIAKDYRLFLEFGLGDAGPKEQSMISDSNDRKPRWLSSFDSNGWRTMVESLSVLYCEGVEVDWRGFDQGYRRNKLILPTYPFRGKSYWIETLPFDRGDVGRNPLETAGSGSTFDGKWLDNPTKAELFRYQLGFKAIPQLQDTSGLIHVGYYLEILNRAVVRAFQPDSFRIIQMEFVMALVIAEKEVRDVTLVLNPDADSEIGFEFYSKAKTQNSWLKHVQGRMKLNPADLTPSDLALELRQKLMERCSTRLHKDSFYQLLLEKGLVLGESVQWVDQFWARPGEALAKFRAARPDELATGYSLKVHPGVFDACAQLYNAISLEKVDPGMNFFVTKWSEVEWYQPDSPSELWCHLEPGLFDEKKNELTGSFRLYDNEGRLVVKVGQGVMKGIGKEQAEFLKPLEVNSHGKPEDQKLLQRLGAAPERLRQQLMTDCLLQIIAEKFSIPPTELDIHESLHNMGMDSIVGMEIKNKIDKTLNINLPIVELIQGPSIESLTQVNLNILKDKLDTCKMDSPAERPSGSLEIGRNLWFPYRISNPAAKFRLFCFPYGSAGPSVFKDWQKNLPDFIEVCPIQLPGKEKRIREKSFNHIHEAVDILEQVFSPELDRPYGFYGHSYGSLLAYQITARLTQNARLKPERLFVAAYSAPDQKENPLLAKFRTRFRTAGYSGIPHPDMNLSLTPDQMRQVVNILDIHNQINQIDMSDLDFYELASLNLPVWLGELKIIESFAEPDMVKIDCPIIGFHGAMDPDVSQKEMQTWQRWTTNQFKFHVLAGDHYFLKDDQNQTQLLELIAAELESFK
jgi:acyl transferase domain-containing protein/surfactin synthase thioesterase subunit